MSVFNFGTDTQATTTTAPKSSAFNFGDTATAQPAAQQAQPQAQRVNTQTSEGKGEFGGVERHIFLWRMAKGKVNKGGEENMSAARELLHSANQVHERGNPTGKVYYPDIEGEVVNIQRILKEHPIKAKKKTNSYASQQAAQSQQSQVSNTNTQESNMTTNDKPKKKPQSRGVWTYATTRATQLFNSYITEPEKQLSPLAGFTPTQCDTDKALAGLIKQDLLKAKVPGADWSFILAHRATGVLIGLVAHGGKVYVMSDLAASEIPDACMADVKRDVAYILNASLG